MDNRKKQSLRSGRKNATSSSSTKTVKKKPKTKSKGGRKGECVTRCHTTSVQGAPESAKITPSADKSQASKTGGSTVTTRTPNVSEKGKHAIKETSKGQTCGQSRHIDGKLELPLSRKTKSGQVHTESLPALQKAKIQTLSKSATKICTQSVTTAGTKDKKQDCPALVYFSELTQNSTLTNTVRPESPSKQFPSTLTTGGNIHKTRPLEEKTQKVYGGGFHFKSACKASTSVTSVKMSVGSPTSAAETARGQRAIDSSSCLQASYSAMVIPERAHHCVTLDLNEWEQAGPLQSVPKRPTSKQNPSDTPGKLTLLSGSGKAMRQGNAATTNCLEHVSPKGYGQQSTMLSPPNPSNTIDDKKRQKDALSQGSGGYGKERDRPPYLDGEEEVLHSRSKYDKEWTLPKRGDSFSIVNLYAKHKAHISPAQESTATAVSSECGLGRRTVSYSIPQKARPLTAQRPVPNHRSPSSSSEFRTYIATCYGDGISNLSESETLFSEILAEACKNKERRLSRKPSGTDFIRSVSKEVSKANGSAEENAIFCHQTETSGPRQRTPKTRISEAVSKDPIQTMKLDVRQPTSTLKNSVQMPSARMQSKLPCELSDMSVDGISMLPTSKACVRDGYTDIFSYDDAEAIALHKVRMQLRKEQRLMRKLRRKQKLEAATFTARLGYHEMINSNSSKHLVHTQKDSELGVSTMSASTQAKILPLVPGEVLPPRHSHASVQEHPPDTRTTKTRPQQVKLNKKGPRKKVHGASKLMKVLGPKNESMPSVVQQAFVLENSIQQSAAKVTGKKLLPTQHNCQILSQNTFGPKASSMTYNLDETNRRCISSAVKIISIEDIASDSSQGRASPEPVAGHCGGHELSASNGGGYSDSFLSNSTTFEQSKSLVPASLHNNLAAAEIVKDVSVEKSNPTPTLHETAVWCIADTGFGHNRMNTAVMPTTTAASQHNQKPLPIAHTSEVMDNKNEKDLQERVTTCDVTSPPSGKEKCSLKPRVSTDSLEKAKLQPSFMQPYILGSQAVHSDVQVEDQSNRTLHAANFESAAWLRDVDRIAASRLAAKTGEETFGGTNATGSEVSRDLQNVKAQTICEIDASKIDEGIIPCKKVVQPEFITDGLSTVELPSFHQNSRETGQIFLAHSPSKRTMRNLGSQGNDIRESKLFSGLSKPFTLAFPMSPGARCNEEECGELPRKSHAQLDLETNLATSSQITSSLVNNLVKSLEDIDPRQTVGHAGGRIKPKPSKQEEILKEIISKNREPERECTSMPTYLPPAFVTSQLITYEDFVSEEALCTEATSTFQEEESLHCLSIPLQTVHTASNLQLSSSRRSRTEKTRNYREGDDNDSMNSITSPLQTVAHLDDENAAVRVDKDISTSPSQHNSEASWKIIKSSPYDPDKCQIDNKTEPPGLNSEHHVEIEKESLYSYLTMRRTQNPGAENLFQRAEAEETFSKGSYCTVSSRCHTSQDAGSLEKFVNSGDDIAHSSTEGAPEAKKVGNKEASPLEQPHDSMRDGENVLQPEVAVLRSPVTSVEEQELINTAQRNWESKDEDEIEEELICEDLDVGTDVSTFFITEDIDQSKVNSDYMSSTWIDEEEQSQTCGSNGATMIWRDQEEVTSLFTDNAEENRETCSISPAIPAVLINSRNPLDMANISAGANNPEKSFYDSRKFSTNAHAQLTGLAEVGAEQATDPTAASLAKIGDMKSEADDKLPARLHEQTTFPEVNGGFSIQSAVKLDTFSSATSSTNTCYLEPQNSKEVLNPKEKRPAYGAYSTAKHNLLANFLTGTLLDTMLREELADTAKRKVQSSLGATSEKRDDPSHNPGSSCHLPTIELPEPAKRLAQSKRKGPFFTALSTPLGVRVSNQAAVKPYQAFEKESRIGSSQDENDLSRSLTPAYAAQYVQTLLKPSCMQGTEIAERQHLTVDVKAITATPTKSNHNTVHKKQLASQNMYNKLLCDAVNDSFRQQTTSYNPRLVQLAGVKTYTNSCKPMCANDAIKTALASIVDDVKFANTARSAGHARCLLQRQVMASCEEWQTSWLETNELLVSELADGILTEMLGSMVLEMPGRRLPDRALCRSTV